VDFGSYPLKLDHNLKLSLGEQFSQLAAPLTLFSKTCSADLFITLAFFEPP
jgi:hypothetical protein